MSELSIMKLHITVATRVIILGAIVPNNFNWVYNFVRGQKYLFLTIIIK